VESLVIKNIEYSDKVSFELLGDVREIVDNISCELEFGNCYCLNSDLTKGGWGLSWILAGKVKPYSGKIYYKDSEIDQKKLKSMSQSVGVENDENIFQRNKSIKNQILKGLGHRKKDPKLLGEILSIFKIDDAIIGRNLHQSGAARFKASMGIGYAHDKKVYCFPWIWAASIISFNKLWLNEIANYLKKRGCLIIIPTNYSVEMKTLFDDVIEFKHVY